MGLRLKTFSGGTIEIVPTDTSSNVTVNIQAANGRLSYADSATGGMYLPAGTTAQRPSTSTIGQMRFNITTGSVETYNGTSWG
jgi:hypothetical protein